MENASEGLELLGLNSLHAYGYYLNDLRIETITSTAGGSYEVIGMPAGTQDIGFLVCPTITIGSTASPAASSGTTKASTAPTGAAVTYPLKTDKTLTYWGGFQVT